jgi:hypothetical protein
VAAVRQLARGEASAGADRLSLDSFEARLGVTRKHALLASQVQAQRLRALLGQGLEAEIVSYGSVPPSRAARNGSPSHRDERLLRSAVSATPVAQPKRDETKMTAASRAEAAIEHDADDVEESDVEVDAAETTVSEAASPQPVTSKPPPLPASSPAPAPAPMPAPMQYVTGYPQMPAMVFTTPPLPPQPRSGGRDTAFLLGGALVAAALIALLWTGRAALLGASPSAGSQAAASVVHAEAPPVAAAAPATAPSAVQDTTSTPPPAQRASASESSGVSVSAPQHATEPDRASTQATGSHAEQPSATGSRHHRRHDTQDEPSADQSPPAPPAPALSARSNEKPAGLTIDDLLDTRR